MEQDSTCPTCRRSLTRPATSGSTVNELAARLWAYNNLTYFDHFFHFDGPSYARWLPSLTVEVTHNIAPFAAGILRRNVRSPIHHGRHASQDAAPVVSEQTIGQWAEQINDMFPQLTREMIALDLQDSLSMEATIDNIIDGRLDEAALEIETDDDDTGSEVRRHSSRILHHFFIFPVQFAIS